MPQKLTTLKDRATVTLGHEMAHSLGFDHAPKDGAARLRN
jgi:hypothetical protein